MRVCILFALLFSPLALAGEEKVDIDMKAAICAELQELTFTVRKEQGGTAVTQTISQTDFDALVVKADTSESAFDNEASSILGAWYDNLPDTTENPGKETFWLLFVALADAD